MNVIMVTTEACGPCKAMKPMVIEAAAEANVHLSIRTVKAGDPLLDEYNVRSVPTLIKLVGDTESERLVGKQTTETINRFFSDRNK